MRLLVARDESPCGPGLFAPGQARYQRGRAAQGRGQAPYGGHARVQTWVVVLPLVSMWRMVRVFFAYSTDSF